MPLKPAFMALYTRSAVRSFFHAVPYTNFGIFVLDSFPRVKEDDKAEEIIVRVRSLVKIVGLINRAAVSADFALLSAVAVAVAINYLILLRMRAVELLVRLCCRHLMRSIKVSGGAWDGNGGGGVAPSPTPARSNNVTAIRLQRPASPIYPATTTTHLQL
jgi:hypothetical protein